MPSEIQVPTGLTTDGLLGRRYLARFIDSIAIVVLFSVLALVWAVVMTGRNPSSPSLVRNLALPSCCFWVGSPTAH